MASKILGHTPSLVFAYGLWLSTAACSNQNGVEGAANDTGYHPVVSGTGGTSAYTQNTGGAADAGGESSPFGATWPPTGFTNVTDVEYGAYALGPEIGNGAASTGTTTIANSGTTCAGLFGVIRDFQAADVTGGHPDFEYKTLAEKGIVTSTLGADRKPVYGDHPDGTMSTHGAHDFNQWYNDDKSVNRTFVVGLKLTNRNNVQSFESGLFFPLDNQGFGNTNKQQHNFHFTTEIHTSFTYAGGETFTFIGDDDVFVYINNQLVIDLGGVHSSQTGSIKVDTLGLEKGKIYPLDIFQAERHTIYSHFRFDTTLSFASCGEVPPILF